MCFAPQRRALFRHFFDIWTSKSGPRPSVFNTFDLETCFAPQRRALFRHLNFQKWSDIGVFCTFWLEMCFAPQRRALFRHLNFQKWSDHVVFCTFPLGNVLRATTACTFSTSQLPKVVRHWCVLYILTWKCASRHNGVHFFISHLASCLRTRRFSEPTFRPSGATNHWKNTVNRDFPTFSRICIFFLLIFSLLTLLTSAFQLSILSEVSLLNFLRLSHDYPIIWTINTIMTFIMTRGWDERSKSLDKKCHSWLVVDLIYLWKTKPTSFASLLPGELVFGLDSGLCRSSGSGESCGIGGIFQQIGQQVASVPSGKHIQKTMEHHHF